MIDEILDLCLLDMRDRRATVADCLAKYPQYARELEPLLTAARALQAVPDVALSPAFKSRTRAQLLELTHRPAPQPFGFLVPRFSFASAAALVLALLGVGSGLVYAAADSLPNTPLYPVKRGAENVQVLFAADPESQARVHMTLAERRLTEAQSLAKSEQNALAERTIVEYDEQVDASLAVLPAAQGATTLLMQELTDRLAQQESSLQTLDKKISAPILDKATSGLQKAKTKLNLLGSPQPTAAPATAVPSEVPAAATPAPAAAGTSTAPVIPTTPTTPPGTPNPSATPGLLPTVSDKATPLPTPPISLPTILVPSLPIQVPSLVPKPNTDAPPPKPPEEKPPVLLPPIVPTLLHLP